MSCSETCHAFPPISFLLQWHVCYKISTRKGPRAEIHRTVIRSCPEQALTSFHPSYSPSPFLTRNSEHLGGEDSGTSRRGAFRRVPALLLISHIVRVFHILHLLGVTTSISANKLSNLFYPLITHHMVRNMV